MGLATIMAWLAIANQCFEPMLMHQLVNVYSINFEQSFQRVEQSFQY
jgi:hypothetical protein